MKSTLLEDDMASGASILHLMWIYTSYHTKRSYSTCISHTNLSTHMRNSIDIICDDIGKFGSYTLASKDEGLLTHILTHIAEFIVQHFISAMEKLFDIYSTSHMGTNIKSLYSDVVRV